MHDCMDGKGLIISLHKIVCIVTEPSISTEKTSLVLLCPPS